MRATTILYTCLAVLLLQACGISAEEKRNIKQEALARKADQDSLQALLTRMVEARDETQAKLALTKAELEAATVSLDRVKGWQFGRSRAERDQQIMSASLRVQALSALIEDLEKHLVVIETERVRTIKNAEYLAGWMQMMEEGQ